MKAEHVFVAKGDVLRDRVKTSSARTSSRKLQSAPKRPVRVSHPFSVLSESTEEPSVGMSIWRVPQSRGGIRTKLIESVPCRAFVRNRISTAKQNAGGVITLAIV